MGNLLFDYISRYMPLRDEEKKAILDLSLFKQYKKGTLLLKKGQVCDYGYFAIKGCIRSYYIKQGDERTAAFCTEAESLNSLCATHPIPPQN